MMPLDPIHFPAGTTELPCRRCGETKPIDQFKSSWSGPYVVDSPWVDSNGNVRTYQHQHVSVCGDCARIAGSATRQKRSADRATKEERHRRISGGYERVPAWAIHTHERCG